MPRGVFAEPLPQAFKKGHTPWLKGTNGLVGPNSGSFKPGHNAGQGHHRYNGGICIQKDGRALIWCRDGKYQFYSRAVMEANLKRALHRDEIVHHINEDKTDDKPSNLTILTRAEHARLHIKARQGGK